MQVYELPSSADSCPLIMSSISFFCKMWQYSFRRLAGIKIYDGYVRQNCWPQCMVLYFCLSTNDTKPQCQSTDPGGSSCTWVKILLLLCSHQVFLRFIHCSLMQTLSPGHYRGRSYCAKGTLLDADLWISLVWNNCCQDSTTILLIIILLILLIIIFIIILIIITIIIITIMIIIIIMQQ